MTTCCPLHLLEQILSPPTHCHSSGPDTTGRHLVSQSDRRHAQTSQGHRLACFGSLQKSSLSVQVSLQMSVYLLLQCQTQEMVLHSHPGKSRPSASHLNKMTVTYSMMW
ncbi:hypothetical protein NP493_163g01012 [Ridgeia piscesae]|uniref:Uncharacterized protein n=1 Tax=Ridgeia piscesae TaxID=27915 RepID=A0AAD9P3I7_RIDPI|nr:hypothetical protein NP493_163g01012 [Ridgeia piscesae]